MTVAFMGIGFWLVYKKQYRTSALAIVLSFLCFVIAQFNGEFQAKFWSDLSLEQFVCWGFAFAFLLLAVYFAHKDSLAYAFVILLISVFAGFCGLSGVQALLKTHLLWEVSSALKSYGEKIDRYQVMVADMQQTLSEQQFTLKTNQLALSASQDEFKIQIADVEKRLSKQQSKIEEAETGVFSQQSNITNQFQKISKLQSELSTAQTNLSFQEEKLTNVANLVDMLYSGAITENLSDSDTNNVIILNLGGVQKVIFKLRFAPIPNSIQAIAETSNGQIPIFPDMQQYKNILIVNFANAYDLHGLFSIRYVRDNRENLLCKSILSVNTNTVSFDGSPISFH
jgi:hypothetical protein